MQGFEEVVMTMGVGAVQSFPPLSSILENKDNRMNPYKMHHQAVLSIGFERHPENEMWEL